MNAQEVARLFWSPASASTDPHLQMQSGQYNMFSVPSVVDVSAMEFSIAVEWDATIANARGSASGDGVVELGASDGGASGDATTVALLFADISDSVNSFAANVPADAAGTSATDLDADDWVNIHVNTAVSGTTGAGAADYNVAYIYGKPGGIN
jgi:SpoU rRNA methylase family enzyme